MPIAKILHGEQGFSYLKPVVAGDTVVVRSRITDIYEGTGEIQRLIMARTLLGYSRDELS